MNTTVATELLPAETEGAARPQWSTPQVECLEAAPEVTAYAGKDDTWLKR